MNSVQTFPGKAMALALAAGAAIALSTAFVGCGGLPERGSDATQVIVGEPRVTSRERYIADRSVDLEWLRAQLSEGKQSDYEQSFQATVGSFTGDQSTTNLKLRADGTGALLPTGGTATVTGGASEGAETKSINPSDFAAPAPTENTQHRTLSDAQIAALVAPGTHPQVSPQEKLSDRLAFRDAVRSAIRQRDFDDTHDLYGNTLHEITMDLTLAAGRDSGNPRVVVMSVEPTDAHGPVSPEDRVVLAEAVKRAAVAETIRRGYTARAVEPTDETMGWFADFGPWPLMIDEAYRQVELADLLRTILEAAKLSCGGSPDFGAATTSEEQKDAAAALAAELKNLKGFENDDPAVLAQSLLRFGTERVCGVSNQQDGIADWSQWPKCLATEARRQVGQGNLNTESREAELERRQKTLTTAVSGVAECFDELRLATALLRIGKLRKESSDYEAFSLKTREVIEPPRDDPRQMTIASVAVDPIILPVERKPTAPETVWDAVRDGRGPFLKRVQAWGRVNEGRLLYWQMHLSAVAVGRQVASRTDNWILPNDTAPVINATLGVDTQGRALMASTPNFKSPGPFPSTLQDKLANESRRSHARVVAVSPTAQVQSIGVDLSSLVSRAVSLDVAAVLGTQVAGGLQTKRLREELLKISQIERQPLIVGFVGAQVEAPANDRHASPTFGWVLGPRFEARQPRFKLWDVGGVEEWERHTTTNYPVTATLVCPAATSHVTLKARAYEILESGEWRSVPLRVNGDANSESAQLQREIKVTLPIDGESFARWVLYGNDRNTGAPTVDPPVNMSREPGDSLYRWSLPLDQKGSITIRGRNLWRNPQVYVGGVKGSVQVMPDLNGLHVTFDGLPLRSGMKYTLQVSTSAGTAEVRDAVEVYKGEPLLPKATLKQSNGVAQPIVVAKDGAATMTFSLDAVPTDFGGFSARLREVGKSATVQSIESDAAFRIVGAEVQVELLKQPGINPDRYEADLFLMRNPGADPIKITKNQTVLIVPVSVMIGASPAQLPVSPAIKVEGTPQKTKIAKGTVIDMNFKGGPLSLRDIESAFASLRADLGAAKFASGDGSAVPKLKAAIRESGKPGFAITCEDDVEFAGDVLVVKFATGGGVEIEIKMKK